jgi:hypothetical protein
MDSPRRFFDPDQEAARAHSAAKTMSETATQILLEELEAPCVGMDSVVYHRVFDEVDLLEEEIDNIGALRSPPMSSFRPTRAASASRNAAVPRSSTTPA